MRGHDPCGAQFQKVSWFGPAREHFVDGHEHLLRFQFWAEVTKLLDRTGRLCTPFRKHALPIGPRDALGWTNLLARHRLVDGSVQC